MAQWWKFWEKTEVIDDTYCHADRDGGCCWGKCPQVRDGEPYKTGRHCPLDFDREEV